MYSHTQSVNPSFEVYPYATDTATGILCAHMYNEHIKEWVTTCDKFKILITAERAQVPVANYWSKDTTSSSNDRPLNIHEYSHEAFVDGITEFIIANNQVFIYYSPFYLSN